MIRKIKILTLFLLLGSLTTQAQIGEHRNDFSVGVNGGYVMSSVKFQPSVPQAQHGGMTGGLSFRYVCEKYFKTICSICAEVNYTQAGWKEDILDIDNNPVTITETGEPLAYSRTINYIQMPIMAHLAWGREVRGMNFFFNAGPQFGYYMSDSYTSNFRINANGRMVDENGNTFSTDNSRVNSVVAQDTMAIEHKFDYGIAVGLGLEYSIPKVGHFLAEARYYYGLGSLYGTSKRDYFGTSNFGQITFKLAYLFDVVRTKKAVRK